MKLHYFFFFLVTWLHFLPAQAQQALWAEGACNEADQNHGATSEYFNKGAELQWQNNLGDWLDRNGVSQGVTPYATIDVADIDKEQQFRVDLTALVSKWFSDELANKGLIVKKIQGGSFRIYSKEYQNGILAPSLELQTTTGSHVITVQADTHLASSTYKCLGHRDTLNTNETVLIYFDIPDNILAQQLTNAELVLNISDRQYGASEVGIFSANPDYRHYSADQQGFGLASDYPNDYDLQTDSRVLLSSTFENSNWGEQWSSGSDRETLSRVSENVEENFVPLLGKALQAQLPEGKLTAMNMYYMFMEEQGEEPEEIYLRYYLRFGDKWQTVDGGKLPGIAGIYDGRPLEGGWGGRTSNGNNGWSARGIFREVVEGNNPLQNKVPIGSYLYHADMEGPYGDVLAWDGQGIGALRKNRWYAIEQYVKLNTPGANDGVFRAWIDGIPAYELTGLKFRNADKEEIKIDRIWMNIYHGGTTPNDRTVHAYLDNVVIATDYIGPINLDPDAPVGGTEPNRAPVIEPISPWTDSVSAVLGEEITFEAEIYDLDGDNLTINWFLDDQQVASDTNKFVYTPTLTDMGEHTVSLEVIDSEGLSAEYQWEVTMNQDGIVFLDILEDTYISESTYKALGTEDSLNSSGVVYMRFATDSQISVDDITAARLVLFDEKQYGDVQIHLYAADNQWREGVDIRDGATRTYADASINRAWNVYLGDWWDLLGNQNGDEAFSITAVEDTDTQKFIQLNADMLIKQQWETGSINIALTSKGGNHKFTARESTETSQHPKLFVTLEGSAPPDSIPTPTPPDEPDSPEPDDSTPTDEPDSTLPDEPETDLPSDTSLPRLAANLQPGQWGVLQTENLSDSLLKVHYEDKFLHIAGWTDDAHWDPKTNQLLFMGFRKKPKFIAYSEDSNNWRVIDEDKEWPHEGNTGHLYGNNALDPQTGRFFYHVGSAKTVYVYSLQEQTWSTLPQIPFSYSGTTSIEYFPELGGIVRLSRVGLDLFVEQTQKWQQLGKITDMGYHSLVRYNSHKAELLVVGGSYEPKKVFKIRSSGEIVELPELPEEVTIRADKLLVHPVTGHYLLFTETAIYNLDTDNGVYTPIEDVNFPYGKYDMPFTASVDNYGVVIFVDSKVWIYKPHNIEQKPKLIKN